MGSRIDGWMHAPTQTAWGGSHELEAIVRAAFEECVVSSQASDPIAVDDERGHVRVRYRLTSACASPRRETFVQLRIHFGRSEIWIGKMHVAHPYRFKGIGRQIAAAVERVARDLGLATVSLYPLYGSDPFWRRIGYESLGPTARVLSKHVLPRVTNDPPRHLSGRLG
jgi:GNAT superfamily N-acetyltransferase